VGEWIPDVPLAAHTTLGVGGPARWFARAGDDDTLRDHLRRARDEGLPLLVLGGGSNLLVADAGFPGLVLQVEHDTWRVATEGEERVLHLGAGRDWDGSVAGTCAEGWSGIECLSGIPGRVGAAPMQNIGAYGQELAGTLESVAVMELATGDTDRLAAADCGFGYRTSHFKRAWRGRWLVTGLSLRLAARPPAVPTYDDLADRLPAAPTAPQVRDAVLAVRRSKGMVLDAPDRDTHSAGSFFTNPVLPTLRAEAVLDLAHRADPDAPRGRLFRAGEGQSKLSAAWLIERAGFRRGQRHGTAGLSSKHVLALMNPGAADLLDLARAIRRRVEEAFGVSLVPEPQLVGFAPGEIADLAPPQGE